MQPTLNVLGLDFDWVNNQTNSSENIAGVIPKINDDYGKYYIDYNSNTNTYSAYYQPNQLDISNDINFYPSDNLETRYDKEFNVINSKRDAFKDDVEFKNWLLNEAHLAFQATSNISYISKTNSKWPSDFSKVFITQDKRAFTLEGIQKINGKYFIKGLIYKTQVVGGNSQYFILNLNGTINYDVMKTDIDNNIDPFFYKYFTNYNIMYSATTWNLNIPKPSGITITPYEYSSNQTFTKQEYDSFPNNLKNKFVIKSWNISGTTRDFFDNTPQNINGISSRSLLSKKVILASNKLTPLINNEYNLGVGWTRAAVGHMGLTPRYLSEVSGNWKNNIKPSESKLMYSLYWKVDGETYKTNTTSYTTGNNENVGSEYIINGLKWKKQWKELKMNFKTVGNKPSAIPNTNYRSDTSFSLKSIDGENIEIWTNGAKQGTWNINTDEVSLGFVLASQYNNDFKVAVRIDKNGLISIWMTVNTHNTDDWTYIMLMDNIELYQKVKYQYWGIYQGLNAPSIPSGVTATPYEYKSNKNLTKQEYDSLPNNLKSKFQVSINKWSGFHTGKTIPKNTESLWHKIIKRNIQINNPSKKILKGWITFDNNKFTIQPKLVKVDMKKNLKGKAYKSIFYEQKINGKIMKIPFIQPKANSGGVLTWDIKSWISTSSFPSAISNTSLPKGTTLKDYLNGNPLDKSKVIFILNKELYLTINPYKNKKIVGKANVYVNDQFQVLKVIDTIDGNKNVILADRFNDNLSNSFNVAFGMDRMGHPDEEGLLKSGFHKIGITLRNYGSNSTSYRIFIDTHTPVPKLITTKEFNDKQLYYKVGNDYFKLYTSTKQVNSFIRDTGLKEAVLSWVDSNGNWYSKKLDISMLEKQGQYIQSVSQTIDYQGLFKLSYTDIANNKDIAYLWIQKVTEEGSNPLIAQARIKRADKKFIIASSSYQDNQYFWVNKKQSHFIVNNLINQNLFIEKQKTNGSWEKATNKEATIITSKQKLSSIGTTINSQHKAHSLMGDEVSTILPSGITKTPSNKHFYQSDIGINQFGRYRINTETDVYKTNEQKELVPITQTIYINSNDKYNLSIVGEQGWSLTHYDNEASFDTETKEVIGYDPKNDDEATLRVAKGTEINITSEFLKKGTLDIKWSPLWYEWYSSALATKYSGNTLLLNSEGRYKINYIDKNNKKHSYSFLVFDWPNRDLSKYGIKHTIDDKGKAKVITEEFYNSPSIATSMDVTTYNISGTFERPKDKTLESEYSILNPSIKAFKVKGLIGYVFSAEKPTWFPGWAKIDDTGETRTKTEQKQSITENKWKITGDGEFNGAPTNLKDMFDSFKTKSINIVYKIGTNISSPKIPTFKEVSIIVKAIDKPKAINKNKLIETAYFKGSYLNLYELSGHKENMMVDNDGDDSTPKVKLLEDKDHFQTSLKEWIAKGGTIDDFWKNKGDQHFGTDDPKKKSDPSLPFKPHDNNDPNNPNNKNNSTDPNNPKNKDGKNIPFDPNNPNNKNNPKSSSKTSNKIKNPFISKKENTTKNNDGALIGALIGGLIGGLGTIFSTIFFIRKRKNLAFAKTPNLLPKRKTSTLSNKVAQAKVKTPKIKKNLSKPPKRTKKLKLRKKVGD